MSGPKALGSSLNCRPNFSDLGWRQNGHRLFPESSNARIQMKIDRKEGHLILHSKVLCASEHRSTNLLKTSHLGSSSGSVIPVLLPLKRTHYNSSHSPSFPDHQILKSESFWCLMWHIYQCSEKKVKI